MSVLKNAISDLFCLLFPDLCCACGHHLHRGEQHLCTQCLYELPYTDHHLHEQNKVARQFYGRIPCPAAMALLHFRKGNRVQQIIHQLKYGNQTGLGIKLGYMLAERLQTAPLFQGIELIMPVPLHKKRERKRGYNQSACIAQGIAEVLNVPLSTNNLLRRSATLSQTHKGRYERFENMKTVFEVTDPAILKEKHILLVDDVITTGATLEACALELLPCGIKKLSIAALAFAE